MDTKKTAPLLQQVVNELRAALPKLSDLKLAVHDTASQTGVQMEYEQFTSVVDDLSVKLTELQTGKTTTGGEIDATADVLAAADDLNNALRTILPDICDKMRLEIKTDADVRKLAPDVQAFLQLGANLGTINPAIDKALDTLRKDQGSPGWRKVLAVVLTILSIVTVVALAILAILQAMGVVHIFTQSDGTTAKFTDSFGIAWSWFTTMWSSDAFNEVLNDDKLSALKTIRDSVQSYTPTLISFMNQHAPVFETDTGQIVVPGVSTGATPQTFTPDTPNTPVVTPPPAPVPAAAVVAPAPSQG